jgi:acetolactate synthase regulatory subunit
MENLKITNIKTADIKALGLITDAALLDKEGKSLAKAINSQDKRIRTYLLSELVHIEEHRNPTRLNKFLTAVRGSGARIMAMHQFIAKFANVEMPVDPKTKEPLTVGQVENLKDKEKKLLHEREDNGEKYFWYYSVRKATRDIFKPEHVGFAGEKSWDGKAHSIMEYATRRNWWEYRPENTNVQIFDFSDKITNFATTIIKNILAPRDGVKYENMDEGLFADMIGVLEKHGLDVATLVKDIEVKVKPSAELAEALHMQIANDNGGTTNQTETPATETPKATRGRKPKAEVNDGIKAA